MLVRNSKYTILPKREPPQTSSQICQRTFKQKPIVNNQRNHQVNRINEEQHQQQQQRQYQQPQQSQQNQVPQQQQEQPQQQKFQDQQQLQQFQSYKLQEHIIPHQTNFNTSHEFYPTQNQMSKLSNMKREES